MKLINTKAFQRAFFLKGHSKTRSVRTNVNEVRTVFEKDRAYAHKMKIFLRNLG